MSWTEPENEPEEELEESEETPKELRAAVTRSNKRATEAEEKASAAERELAFLKAEVDLEDPVGKLLLDSYNGELTKEAIQTRWMELKGIKPEGSEPEKDDLEAAQAREALGEGAQGDTGQAPPEDPRKVALADAQADLDRGAPRDEAMGTYFHRIVDAAIDGDERVLVQE